jgi:hypothetical protein
MHYVILRDDDTNALTPISCLERLYRPFLERGLPVNLAVIPEVRQDARRPDGQIEGFLPAGHRLLAATRRMEENPDLVAYLRANPGYHVVQHGCFHDCFEFGRVDAAEAAELLDRGKRRLCEAGFDPPRAFVAPHDRFSRAGLASAAQRFEVISSGWFEWGRQPRSWWPRYAWKKARSAPHWRVGGTALLSHPGCLLSRNRPLASILPEIRRQVEGQRLTVLVTHWWEYYEAGVPGAAFVDVLHETAAYLSSTPGVRVISFGELAGGAAPLD